ncbi:MAG: SET domain-containing protein [Thiohalomonadales bacterium]
MNLSYRSPKTKLRESAIHGQGLFAVQAIKVGEIVAIKGGCIVPLVEWKPLEKELGSAEIQITEDFVIAPGDKISREGSMLYLNHSCEPNCAISGQIIVVAMMDIERDEELTHDWATTDDLDYEINCHCGKPSCRGVLTGKDWMIPALQKKYHGWFCWFIARKIAHISAQKKL